MTTTTVSAPKAAEDDDRPFGSLAATVVLEDVPLCAVGTWNASTGSTAITEEDFADILAAAQDPQIDHAPVHAGHYDSRFPALTDGEPAMGWVVPERVSNIDGRAVLIGRIENVPYRLAEIMRKAWRRRSVEVSRDVEGSEGKRYRMVLRGLGLLGVQPPAVKGLADVIARYSAAPEGSPVEALQVGEALSADTSEKPASPVQAPEPESLESSTSGESEPGSRPSRGGSVPRRSDEQIRALLSLPDDSDVSDLQALLVKIQDGEETPEAPAAETETSPEEPAQREAEEEPAQEQQDQPPAAEPVTTPDQAPPVGDQTKEQNVDKIAASEAGPQVVTLSAGALEALEAKAKAGEEALAILTRQRLDTIIGTALSEGRITPADEQSWREALSENEQRTVTLLSTLRPASGLPTTEVGSDAALSSASAEDEAWADFRQTFLRIPAAQNQES